MNTERDKFLTEAMSECWHDYIWPDMICKKCQHKHRPYTDNNFSTWEGFGKLWKWSNKQEWWIDFVNDVFPTKVEIAYQTYNIIDPDRFANTVYKFLKGSK